MNCVDSGNVGKYHCSFLMLVLHPYSKNEENKKMYAILLLSYWLICLYRYNIEIYHLSFLYTPLNNAFMYMYLLSQKKMSKFINEYSM